jgi:hypothetical protein
MGRFKVRGSRGRSHRRGTPATHGFSQKKGNDGPHDVNITYAADRSVNLEQNAFRCEEEGVERDEFRGSTGRSQRRGTITTHGCAQMKGNDVMYDNKMK